MVYALYLYDDNRIHSACGIIRDGNELSDEEVKSAYPDGIYRGAPIVYELPDGQLRDYLYIDNQYVYDPIPKPEKPEPTPAASLEERVATVESDVADLTAAIERGLAL